MTTEELKNAAGFKAVDAEGNELGVVSLSDIVSAVKQELQPSGVARASVAALSEVSAQAATDTYEDQLPQKTDVTWIRGLDESGNPILISKQSLVSVLEGLLPVATTLKNGLMPSYRAIYEVSFKPGEGNHIVKVCSVYQYGIASFFIMEGIYTDGSIHSGFVYINNRSQNSNGLYFYSTLNINNQIKLYCKYIDDRLDVYVKLEDGYTKTAVNILYMALCSFYVTNDTSISDSDLTELT